MNHNVDLANQLVSRGANLQEQLEHIEGREVLQIVVGLIEDASGCGCAAGAFRVVLVALEHAADRVLVEMLSKVIQ